MILNMVFTGILLRKCSKFFRLTTLTCIVQNVTKMAKDCINTVKKSYLRRKIKPFSIFSQPIAYYFAVFWPFLTNELSMKPLRRWVLHTLWKINWILIMTSYEKLVLKILLFQENFFLTLWDFFTTQPIRLELNLKKGEKNFFGKNSKNSSQDFFFLA